MKIELTSTQDVTPEKAKFVEEQANKLLTFLMDARDVLRGEAHTTLQWLFAIIVGASGYVATLLQAGWPHAVKWWLVLPLTAVVIAITIEAIRLFRAALQTADVLPMGNEPKNLITDELMQYDEHLIRLAEAAQLQERIDEAAVYNQCVGDAINEARWVVAIVPIVAVLAMGVGALTSERIAWAEQPGGLVEVAAVQMESPAAVEPAGFLAAAAAAVPG